MSHDSSADGIHALPPRDKMAPEARKLRDTYAITPGIPLVRREFGYYCLDEWKAQGMPQDIPLEQLFHYDPPGFYRIGHLGWTQAQFEPLFEVKILEDRGEHEVEQDTAGRHVLYFKGRRSGFMPEYIDHPVKDMRTWQEDVKWRLDPTTPARYAKLEQWMAEARAAAAQGKMIQLAIGGIYMYLRSLMGPLGALYGFYDMPDVIRDCVETWFRLADHVSAIYQQHVTIDEVYFGEDICYKAGPLIGPNLWREFLFPYYQQLISNIKARQIDRTRHLYFQLDTDGYGVSVIPWYRELGMDVLSPNEVASGCDVVQIARDYPDLVLFGGIDKRVLASGREAIDRHLEYILPPLRARGGYIATCDHGVPAEVPYQDYLYYRQRCLELGG